jgi:hypothetical protein
VASTREVTGSKIQPGLQLSSWRFFAVFFPSSRPMPGWSLEIGYDPFHIVFSSSFINDPTIGRCIIRAIESVVK